MKSRRRRRRSRRKPDEIQRLLNEFEHSGLSKTEFCQAQGIHTSLLYRWLRDKRRNEVLGGKAPTLIPIHIQDGGFELGFEVVVRNGRAIRIPPNFDERALLRLVRVLETGC